MVDFTDFTIESVSSSDDAESDAYTVDGCALQLFGNTWKAIAQSGTLTEDTVVQFQFRSSLEGQIHGIGFGDRSNLLCIGGSQTDFGIQAHEYDLNYDGTTYTTYTLKIANYPSLIGISYSRIFFVNDDDDYLGADSTFRYLRVYEEY